MAPGDRFGPYEVGALLGVGGMGEVYRARDTKLDRDVAMKVLPDAFATNPDRLARFEREAKTLASLNHPNIAHIHGLEESNGTRALVMELVDGEDLAQRLARGPVPLDEALPIARQIAEALEAAHEQGVIHRDLKPANVKVRPDGTVKVLDFGLAKAMSLDASHTAIDNSPTITSPAVMTGANMILGTAAYMAPEQAKGRVVDRRADIWAFGCVVFEMLSGRRAFGGETISEVLAKVIEREPEWKALPAATPAALRRLLMLCVKKDPRARLRDVSEARRQIDELLSGGSDDIAQKEISPAMPVWQRASLRAVVATAFVVLFGVSLVHLLEVTPAQPATSFQVRVPEKTSGALSTAAMFQLSPDGRALAISAFDGARRHLWLRPLKSLEVHMLPGTDGATYPFWSPDSSSIGFFADGKLKKIAVAGGPPQTLTEAVEGRGATWGADGVIVFGSLSNGLARISAGSDAPTPITTPGQPGEVHRFPAFVPHSTRLLYVVTSGAADRTGIYITSKDGANAVRLLPDDSKVVYLPSELAGSSGYLLFRREGTLMAQPFNPGPANFTGEMFPIAEQVGTSANVGNGAFSASENGVLAYATGGSANREILWKDRTGQHLTVVGPPGRGYSTASLSPEENRVTFTILKDADESDVWVHDLVRGIMSRVTFLTGHSIDAVWAPDGDRIAFAGRFGIHVQTISGKVSADHPIARGGNNTRPLDWSRDGKFLLYQVQVGRAGSDLWLLPLEDAGKPMPYLETAASETSGQFSPDGRWIAYTSNESGQPQFYVQNVPANGDRRQVSPAGGEQPRWRRDGAELFYIAADQKLMAVPVKSGARFDSGTPEPLFELQSFYGPLAGRFAYAPSSDGQRFLVTSTVGEGTPITVVLNWPAVVR